MTIVQYYSESESETLVDGIMYWEKERSLSH